MRDHWTYDLIFPAIVVGTMAAMWLLLRGVI